MPKKFYVVRKGRNPGIYTSWDECKRQVTGFKGAEFKGFETEAEANSYFHPEEKVINAEAIAYTDGSYNVKNRYFSYGVVIFWKGEKLTFSESFFDEELSEMRNVAGEIKGAERAFKFCIDNGIKSLELFFDYAGVEKWCTGEWKRNKKGTVRYHDYYKKISKSLDVKFTKVKGHSGDTYNDEADMLAKAALGLLHR